MEEGSKIYIGGIIDFSLLNYFKTMETRLIYLVYQTDEWHSLASRLYIYIGEDMEDIIAQLIAYRGMTEDDANEIRSTHIRHSATTETMVGV